MSVSKQSLRSGNSKKTKNKLKTGLNELEFRWKKRKPHTNADTHRSSFKFAVESVSLSGLVGKTLAPKPCRFFSLGSNPDPRNNYDFFPFFPLFFFVTFKRSFILI
jgi:hypothetical protein